MKPRSLHLVLLVAVSATSVFVDSAEACWRRRCRRCYCPCPYYQDAIKLSWRFEKGKPFYQQMTTTTKQTMKVMDMPVTQNQSQTFYIRWTPKERDWEGNWIIEQKIEGVKMDIEIAGTKVILYDSTKDVLSGDNPLADFFKALINREINFWISPDMKIIRAEGRDDLGEDVIPQMAQLDFAVVPTTPLKMGQTWYRKSTLNMGPIGSYDSSYKYTYEGKQGMLDKIKVDTKLNYVPAGANTASSLPFRIKEAKLSTKEASGMVLFDNHRHRLESSNQRLKLEGTLKIDIGGIASEVELTQEQTTIVYTSDTNPIADKE